MRFLFSRPSSLHDDPDPEQLIKWADDGLPKLFRGRAVEVITDDERLAALYDELIEREQAAGSD
jgi:hypothetical protein